MILARKNGTNLDGTEITGEDGIDLTEINGSPSSDEGTQERGATVASEDSSPAPGVAADSSSAPGVAAKDSSPAPGVAAEPDHAPAVREP